MRYPVPESVRKAARYARESSAEPASARGGRVATITAGVAFAVLGLGVVGVAPASAQELTVGGQLRPRVEHQTASPGAPTPDPFTSLRTRVHLRAELTPRLGGLIQLQDVRGWGTVPGNFPNGGHGRLDLHQGYIEAGAWDTGPVAIRLGRQEVGLGEERLVGAADWAQPARALDGLRTRIRFASGWLDLFGFRVDDRAAATAADGALAGAYATLAARSGRALDLFGLYDHNDAGGGTDQVTLGARVAGKDRVAYRAEAAYQFGERGGREVGAFLLGARVGTTTAGGRLGLTLWYDYLSGSADPSEGEVRAFDTLLGSNHKYYGQADFFTAIPTHTAGRGLQDLALESSYRVNDDVACALALHSFHLARAGGLASGRLGEELDLTAKWRLAKGVELAGGLHYLRGGPALRELGRLDGNRTTGYLMLNTTF